ncbi:MAG: hypothetical protein WDM84_03720 [Bauldia sp.]
MHKIALSAFVLSLFAAGQAFAAGTFVTVVSKASGGTSSFASASVSVKSSSSSSGPTTTTVTYSGKSSGGGGVVVFGFTPSGPIHNGCTGPCSVHN